MYIITCPSKSIERLYKNYKFVGKIVPTTRNSQRISNCWIFASLRAKIGQRKWLKTDASANEANLALIVDDLFKLRMRIELLLIRPTFQVFPKCLRVFWILHSPLHFAKGNDLVSPCLLIRCPPLRLLLCPFVWIVMPFGGTP